MRKHGFAGKRAQARQSLRAEAVDLLLERLSLVRDVEQLPCQCRPGRRCSPCLAREAMGVVRSRVGRPIPPVDIRAKLAAAHPATEQRTPPPPWRRFPPAPPASYPLPGETFPDWLRRTGRA